MIKKICQKLSSISTSPKYAFSQASQGSEFLANIEGFFDKAAIHTGIRTDRLHYYKKAENVVKCSIPLIRGIFELNLDNGTL